MLTYIYIAAFGLVACYLWTTIIDGSFRHAPSQWLAYCYVVGIALIVTASGKHLGNLVLHPYASAAVILIALVAIIVSAMFSFRRARQWDQTWKSRKQL